jgi:hypothetical protein
VLVRLAFPSTVIPGERESNALAWEGTQGLEIPLLRRMKNTRIFYTAPCFPGPWVPFPRVSTCVLTLAGNDNGRWIDRATIELSAHLYSDVFAPFVASLKTRPL